MWKLPYRTALFGVFSLLTLCIAAPSWAEEPSPEEALIVSKDMTINAEQYFETMVVLKGLVDFYGTAGRMIVIDGKVRLHDQSQVLEDMIVVGGQVEQLAGARVPDKLDEEPSISTLFSRLLKKSQDFFLGLKDKWFSWKSEKDSSSEESSWSFHFPTSLFWFPLKLAFLFGGLVLLAIMGLILFSIAPQLSLGADRILQEEPFLSLIWGGLVYLLFFPFLLLLALSLIGIPLVPVALFFFVLAILGGLFSVSRSLGALLLKRIRLHSPFLWTIFGLILLLLVSMIPSIGGALVFVLCMTGVGAVMRSFFDTRAKLRLRHISHPTTFDI